jgi:hypothetical protein
MSIGLYFIKLNKLSDSLKTFEYIRSLNKSETNIHTILLYSISKNEYDEL